MVVIEISYEPASHRRQGRAHGHQQQAPVAAAEQPPQRPLGRGWQPKGGRPVLGRHRQQRPGGGGHRQRQHTRAACPSSAHTPRPARMAASATRSSTPSKSAPRGSPRSCGPLRRGLRTALQLTTITLLSTGALVTVLKNGLLQTREEYSAFSALLLPSAHTPPSALDARGRRLSPGSTGSPQDAPTDGPLDPGTKG